MIDFFYQLGWRLVVMFIGLWCGVGMVIGAVVMVEAWKRRHNKPVRIHYATVECPACDGWGVNSDHSPCSLCDGESAIMQAIEQ